MATIKHIAAAVAWFIVFMNASQQSQLGWEPLFYFFN